MKSGPTFSLQQKINEEKIRNFRKTLKRDLQKQYVVKRDVGHGSVHWKHEAGIIQLSADFGQTEHRESPIVTFILEMVGVPPHQRES